jgi:hypothetical protein
MIGGSIPIRGTLKMARHKEQTDANGDLTASIKIPGTPGQDARLLIGGEAWFETHHADDVILEVWMQDDDDIIPAEMQSQFPAYPKVANYTDMDAAAANQGWYFGPDNKIHVEAVADIREVGAGFYLKFKVKKGDSTQDTLRVNLIWGDPNDK